eukprot:m.176500 g.176500  ORF g.176500 m.176500 type:complete len:157 (+) comp14902_c0_seq1:216-686(+)
MQSSGRGCAPRRILCRSSHHREVRWCISRDSSLAHFRLSTMSRATAVLLWAIVAAQDPTPCEYYDINTGSGTCNGISVNVGAAICGHGFNPTKCNAGFAPNGVQGNAWSFYFKASRAAAAPACLTQYPAPLLKVLLPLHTFFGHPNRTSDRPVNPE